MSISSMNPPSPFLTPPPEALAFAQTERENGYREGYEKGANDGFAECKADVKQIFKESGITLDQKSKHHFLDGIFA